MIETSHISKRYGDVEAVSDVSFQALPGRVTGFLGPNGAGKSTTLRMIAGLTVPSSGSARVFGVDYRDLPNPGREAGVLLDASAMHSGRTGRETLRLYAGTIGVDAGRVQDVLDRVGLEPSAARRRVGTYSLGMRQRLGLAQVLLGEPSALILDEPANGLDPEGIIWMRNLLRDFADHGGTVLLSSHLLNEVEAVADDLVLIHRGRIVAQGAKRELLAGSATLARGLDQEALAGALATAGIEITHANGAVIAEAAPEAISAAAMAAGVPLTELRPAQSRGLEDLFLSLTTETEEKTAR